MVSAIPTAGSSLRVVSNATLDAAARAEKQSLKEVEDKTNALLMTNLAGFVRRQFDVFRNHRNDSMAGWNERLLVALRAFNGQYDTAKLNQIRQFGGSEVYARTIAMKCRGASSLLRDVYLAPDRPWGLNPNMDPDIPPEILQSIGTLVQTEVASMMQPTPGAPITLPDGTQAPGKPVPAPPPDVNAVKDRTLQLLQAARDAAKKNAAQQANIAEDKMDEILTEGKFYHALAEFIVDLPLFPFACIKGPVVRIVPTVKWVKAKAQIKNTPKLFWARVSPFDLYWTPGAADIEDADVIERTRVTRSDLNDLLDLPGYNQDEVRAVLDEYGSGGLNENWDSTDAERAVMENRENPQLNRSGLISCLEYHGNVQGKMLLEWGMGVKEIPDPLRDYMVQLWMIGRHVIKVQLSPSPRKRHPYFITSFEKVPGTPVGNGLPDILADVAEVSNAALRSLVNNLSIASGPQVVVNDDRIAPGEDGEEIYPWKRWHVTQDPMNNASQKPIDFFQPQSYAQELLAVYDKFNEIADDLSAIPKYLSGGPAGGGAGRTASGLAMLMGNASKILQTVAANIDRDILEGALTGLFDMLMMTDHSGLLTGEESVKVMGVQVALQRETQRSRQLEFLQITGNPVDMQIIGPKGRASVLRAVSQTIGLDGADIVPSDTDLAAQQKQAQQVAQQQGQPGHSQGQPGPGGGSNPPGNPPPQGGAVTGTQGPVTSSVPIQGGAH